MTKQRKIRVEIAPAGDLAGRFEAMASPCEVLADGAGEVEIAELTALVAEEVWRIERHWSRYLQGNIVDRINTAQGKAVKVDDETSRFLNYARHLYEMSEGLFDVTSGVLRRVWRFDGSDNVPNPEDVEAVLPLVGWDKLTWNPPILQMKPGMQIDFGGIGKEYAVDRALGLAALKTERPILVNCGGDLAANGPHLDGQPWVVGIDSHIPGTATPVIHLLRGGVASSGDAHRFLLKDGVRYPHILNPKTGWPVVGGPRVVTVAGSICTEAGVLSTLALLHGPRADEFLKELEADSQVIW